MSAQAWKYAFPSGTATVGFDTAAQTATVACLGCNGDIKVTFVKAGTTTSFSFDVFVSQDGANWLKVDDDVAAEETVAISGPFNYVKVTLTAVNTTDDIIVMVAWVV